jgi:hypothetical protein
MQIRLKRVEPRRYTGLLNQTFRDLQVIRISEGCPNQCPYCYEPKELIQYDIPRITRNFVKIYDMNFLAQKRALDRILILGSSKHNKKKVYYDLCCGLDYRLLNFNTCKLLHDNGFINPRIAWDFFIDQQIGIQNAIKLLVKVGYQKKNIMVFILCNYLIPFDVCCQKLDQLKVFGVNADDNYFDGQAKQNLIIPLYWTDYQLKSFRQKVRKHNQLIRHDGYDPEV